MTCEQLFREICDIYARTDMIQRIFATEKFIAWLQWRNRHVS